MQNETNDIAFAAVDREKTIVKTSIIGIVANVFLAAFKAAVGIISNSIKLFFLTLNISPLSSTQTIDNCSEGVIFLLNSASFNCSFSNDMDDV